MGVFGEGLGFIWLHRLQTWTHPSPSLLPAAGRGGEALRIRGPLTAASWSSPTGSTAPTLSKATGPGTVRDRSVSTGRTVGKLPETPGLE